MKCACCAHENDCPAEIGDVFDPDTGHEIPCKCFVPK